MILDEQALFSDKQEVKATAASTNVIKVNGDIGKGEPVEVLIQVVEDFAGATSCKVAVQTCDTENGTFTDLVATDAIAVAKLKAGYKVLLLGNHDRGADYYKRIVTDITDLKADLAKAAKLPKELLLNERELGNHVIFAAQMKATISKRIKGVDLFYPLFERK